MDTLGDRIKMIRKKHGLTMEEFGKQFNPTADKSNVSRWEKNKAAPSNDRLKQIAELGDTTIEYLLTGRISIRDAINQNISMKTYIEANGLSSVEIAKKDENYKENVDILIEEIKKNLNPIFNSALYSLMEIHQKSPDHFIEVAAFLETLSETPVEKEQQTDQQKAILDFIRESTFND